MTHYAPVPIAIIGIGCRLPGDVTDTETLWDLLVQGKNCWTPVPTERYNEAAFYHPKSSNNGTTNHRGGHFLSQDISAFDAAFFGISPLEAQAMDPQQRLLLEVSYEAFENAGIPIENVYDSNTAVYVAMFTRDYDRNIYKDTSDVPKYHVTGTGEAIISNRISYTFNLKGPSMTLDTGCSGSIVALHQACQSLRTGESNMALASGVSLTINPDHMIAMSNLDMLSDDGRSYPFDARGSGYGRGEGVSVILLKRLVDAVQAGDSVRAIIRNSAINQDGRTSGITLPSQHAQECLERSTFEVAGIDPHSISYIETHGTGTAAGDLAELQGIANVFSTHGRHQDKLYVGSIKSNIGHLESASGLAGLIKTVVMLEKGMIPPNADFQRKKQRLKLEEWNMKVPTKLEPWPVRGETRQASVNSFGYGGTNAHVILESAPSVLFKTKEDGSCGNVCTAGTGKSLVHSKKKQTKVAESHDSICKYGPSSTGVCPITIPQLFVLSAKSKHSLLQLLAKVKEWAVGRPDLGAYLENLAYNLSSRRSLMQWRYSFVASSHLELMASLNPKNFRTKKALEKCRVAFVFTGQGAQWFAMGRELLYIDSHFAASLMKSDAILRDLGSSWSLLDELQLDANNSRIHQGDIAQPASTALQIALVDLLASIGIKPQMVLGHSSGEIAAAYASGILCHEVALKVSYCRSFVASICRRLIPARGAMLSVGLGEESVLDLIADVRKGDVSVACVNSPGNTTVSGDEAAILEIQETLDKLGVFNRKLKVDTAYHSHHMRKVAQQYLSSLGTVFSEPPRESVTFISSVTTMEKTQDFGAAYWVENLVSKVRFCDALKELCRMQSADLQNTMIQSTQVLVEIGPHSALSGPIQQTISQGFESLDFLYLSTLSRGRAAVHSVLETVGKMFELGYPVDLTKANSFGFSNFQPQLIRDLPAYPWDHSNTYWHESRVSRDYRLRQNPPHDLLGVRIPSSTPLEPSWRRIISIQTLPWLEEHIIDGLVVFPGSAYICMAVEALRELISSSLSYRAIRNFVLQKISFSKALIIPSAPLSVETLINLRIQNAFEATWYDFRIFAISQDEAWHEHCSGRIKVDLGPDSASVNEPTFDQDSVSTKNTLTNTALADCSRHLRSNDIYDQLRSNGNVYGPLFAAISDLRMGQRQAVSRIRIPDVQSVMPSQYQQPHIIHPTTFDALMHTALPLYAQNQGSGSVMPTFVHEIILSSDIPCAPGEELIATTSLATNGHASATSDIVVFAGNREKEEVVLTVSRLEIRGMAPTENAELNPPQTQNKIYHMEYARDVDFVSPYIRDSLNSPSIAEYLKLLSFKYSHMAVLEMDGGTGQSTAQMVQQLMSDGSTPIASYDFTDVTSEFFEEAQNHLDRWKPLIRFRTLDARLDPLEQGYERSSYDLIIAADLPFPSSHFDVTVENVRKLLKPGGRLIFNKKFEGMTNDGALHQALGKHKFSGGHFCLDQMSDSTRTREWVVSQDVDSSTKAIVAPLLIIAERGLESFASLLDSALKDHNLESMLTTWASYDSTYPAIYIILDNGAWPYLSDLTQERFTRAVDLLTARSNIFWITAQEDESTCMNPEKGLITGLARSARAENPDLKITTLDVQEAIGKCASDLFLKIIDLLSINFSASVQYRPSEAEYVFRDRQILIPRLVTNLEVNAWIGHAIAESNIQSPYLRSQNPMKLNVETTASLTSLRFVTDLSTQGLVSDYTIEVEARVHSLNSIEVQNVSRGAGGNVPVIHEFAGIVSAVGLKTGGNFQVGDRVCAWTSGGVSLPSRIRVDMDRVTCLPESVPLVDGAIIPVAFMTAYYSLYKLGHLRQGQMLLVHGADSDIGQAALTIAQHLGADVLATASSTAERKAISTTFQVPLSRIFGTKDPALTHKINEYMKGKGVDVVLNALSREMDSNVWACVAILGTCIQIGNPWNPAKGPDTFPFVDKNAIFLKFDLPGLIRDRPQEAVGLLGSAVASLEHSRFVTGHSATEMSMAAIEDAFRKLRGRKRYEKVILESDESTRVKALSTLPLGLQAQRSKLDANATYIVAGGSGDLGQEICLLMACSGAKTIVVLSRRALSDVKKHSLEERLQSFLSELRIFHMTCDISKKSMVDEWLSKLKTLNLPPIKGVFQSATVLRDSVLEGMTLEDFEVPLQAKMRGTRYLSDAFEKSSLDFFIMLSSLSGVVGSRGQANYAAGSTFQDALAHCHTASGTHYIALDLGMVEGTSAYRGSVGQAREKNLIRQGWIPVKHQELLAIVDYAMSPQARSDSCHQAAIGIDGTSIHEADSATPTMESPVFTHVRDSYHIKPFNRRSSDRMSVRDSILAAASVAEVRQIIDSAIIQRLSSITMLDLDSIDPDAQLQDYGLDSLTAVELKNSIQKDMDASVQASEILDELSIKTLSMKVASRSKLIQESIREDSPQVVANEAGSSDLTLGPFEKDVPDQKDPVFALPPLPLPNLEDTLDLYLKSAQPFLSDNEFENTSLAIREFDGGFGQMLQQRLLERSRDPRIDNWQHDLQVHAVYLRRRDPVHPYGTFYTGHPTTDPPHSQVERAAVVSAAAYEFKRRLDAGKIAQDYLNGEPICMDSLTWLFNTAREPAIGIDKVCRYPGNNYLVALRRGHFFKIMLEEDGRVASYSNLKLKFEAVLEHSMDKTLSLAVLTADERNDWARLQESVKSLSPDNNALISMINAAAFVVCLDDDSPATPSERCNQFLLGDPSNRWSDKSLQFVICANGVSGYICEHSMLDYTSLKQIHQFVTRAILEQDGHMRKDNQHNQHSDSVDKHIFMTNASILGHIDRVQKEFGERYFPVELSHFRFPDVGNVFLRTHKIPSKAGVQLIIQLASLLYYGRHYAAWEAVSMMPFHQGRLDWMQVVSPAMHSFCQAATDNRIPLTKRLGLLRDAAQSHARTMTRIARGRGFAAHLEALQEVVGKDEPLPALFKDTTWQRMRTTNTRKIKTDASEVGMAQEAGFFMPDPEGVLVHYEIEDDGCILFVQSSQGRTLPFCEALSEAERVVKKILEMR